MKWIEIIDLRISEEFSEEVTELLATITAEVSPAVTLYVHAFMYTDFSIHIKHESEKVDQSGSNLGMQIASSLKAYGLVNHNVWIETRSADSNRDKVEEKNE